MKCPQLSRPRRAFELILLCVASAVADGVLAAADSSVVTLRLEVGWRAEGEAGGYWVLKRLPRPEEVIAPDPLKTALQKAITSIRDADKTNHQEWNLKRRDPANFVVALTKALPAYVDVAVRSQPEPGSQSGVVEIVAPSQQAADTGPSVTRKAIEISIVVRGSTAIARQPVITTIGNIAAHGLGEVGEITPEEAQIKVLVHPTDAISPQAVAWADSPDHRHAFAAAIAAFKSAKANNLSANQPFGPESQRNGDLNKADDLVQADIDSYVKREFGLPGDWQPVPPEDLARKRLETVYGPGPWKIRIALQAVGDVTFRIRGSRIEGNIESLEAHPGWASDIAALEHKIQEREGGFAALRGRLLTNDDYLSAAKEIRRDVELEHRVINALVETGERTISVTGEFLPRVTDLEAGVGYSTDKQLSGSVSLTSRNAIVDDSLLKLSAVVGMEKQTGEFSYALPYFVSHDGRSSATLDINASYGKDNDLLLGTPQFDGFDEQRFAGSIRNTFHFTTERADADASPAPELRPSQIYALMVAASAGLSDSRLTAPPELRAQTESGQILFLLLDAQQSFRSKLRPREQRGLGEIQLLWNATAKKAFKAGPGDFDFFASNTSVTGTIYFGDRSSRDFIVRLTIGGAFVTGNNPVFEEYRIGGDTIVRGMEEGERTARGLIFDSLQFGVALERLWPGGSDALGFGLKNFYATLLFDHALITRQGSAVPPPPGESHNFESVGVSLEMALPGNKAAGSLEFGYAWSPQSIHDHGRVFTTVRFNF